MTTTKRTWLLALTTLVAVALLATLVFAYVPNALNKTPIGDNSAQAIGAAAEFGKLANGSKFSYSQKTGTTPTMVTVVSTAKWGTDSNPYVISTPEQWLNLINKVNANTTVSADRAAYPSASYLLQNNLDFGNATIAPVGNTTNKFSGKLFGDQYVVSNVKITYAIMAEPLMGDNRAVCGLFGYTDNATIVDFGLASTVTILGGPTTDTAVVGALIGFAKNQTLINCSSNVSMNLVGTNIRTGSPGHRDEYIGGLIGVGIETASFYKCVYRGTLKYTEQKCVDDNLRLGGFIGALAMDTPVLTLDSCYIDANITCTGGAADAGGVIGGPWYYGTPALHTIMTNVVVKCIITPDAWVNQSPTYDGLDSWNPAAQSSGVYTNVYVTSNQPVSLWANATINNVQVTHLLTYRDGSSGESGNASAGKLSWSNDYDVSVAYPDKVTYADKNPTTDKQIYSAAATSTAIKNAGIAVDANTGSAFVASEPGAMYKISYDLGASDAAWAKASSAPTTFTKSPSSQNVSALSKANGPTRPGFTFKGWAFTKSASATVINESGTGAIPAKLKKFFK